MFWQLFNPSPQWRSYQGTSSLVPSLSLSPSWTSSSEYARNKPICSESTSPFTTTYPAYNSRKTSCSPRLKATSPRSHVSWTPSAGKICLFAPSFCLQYGQKIFKSLACRSPCTIPWVALNTNILTICPSPPDKPQYSLPTRQYNCATVPFKPCTPPTLPKNNHKSI